MLLHPLFAALALMATPLLATSGHEVVREQRSFTVNGSKEVWRLIWRGSPKDGNSCGPTNADGALTCPCDGVAYAQVGDLLLERRRPGVPLERMPLTPLFAGSDMLFNEKSPVAILPRWPTRARDINDDPTPAAIRSRPAVPIMRLRDYDHDGIAGEFLLQVDTLPCGKHVLVAIGITRNNPHLHVLHSAEHPGRPLALFQWQWAALARSPRPGRIMDWPCGDHAAEEETTMVLRADRGQIHADRITSTCPNDIEDAHGKWHHDDHFRKRMLKREVM